jgi:hypothetical protein
MTSFNPFKEKVIILTNANEKSIDKMNRNTFETKKTTLYENNAFHYQRCL